MESIVKTISGGKHSDDRGTLVFINDFDLSEVKRMYMIHHPETTINRGWRGHRLEQRWFFVCQGDFEVKVVKIDDWEQPDPYSDQKIYVLSANDPCILHVPKNYATCFRALIPDSKCMVYADAGIEQAKEDNYLYDVNYFK